MLKLASLIVYHLALAVQSPTGETTVIILDRYPDKAWREADREKLVGTIRQAGPITSDGRRIISTGCISLKARGV